MRTPVNSIEIPSEFVELASQWHDGQASMLYAIASTGELTTGTIKPVDCENREVWYHSLWQGLELELYHILKNADGPDNHELIHFQRFAETTADQLYEEYGIEAIDDAYHARMNGGSSTYEDMTDSWM